jgi:hypothetical protein
MHPPEHNERNKMVKEKGDDNTSEKQQVFQKKKRLVNLETTLQGISLN